MFTDTHSELEEEFNDWLTDKNINKSLKVRCLSNNNIMTSTTWNSLACEVNLGRDTKLSKKGNKHISICPGSFYITRDGDHLIHWNKDKRRNYREA